MKRFIFLFSAVVLILTSCDRKATEFEPMLNRNEYESHFEVPSLTFFAHLTGGNEVAPTGSLAQGQAFFRLSKDSSYLEYELKAANLDNILMSHIHAASAGQNGGIVVWLYPSQPPAVLIPGITNGEFAEGKITKSNLTGALANHELSDLIRLMKDGNTYVNIHTTSFPGGEIRGQITELPESGK